MNEYPYYADKDGNPLFGDLTEETMPEFLRGWCKTFGSLSDKGKLTWHGVIRGIAVLTYACPYLQNLVLDSAEKMEDFVAFRKERNYETFEEWLEHFRKWVH